MKIQRSISPCRAPTPDTEWYIIGCWLWKQRKSQWHPGLEWWIVKWVLPKHFFSPTSVLLTLRSGLACLLPFLLTQYPCILWEMWRHRSLIKQTDTFYVVLPLLPSAFLPPPPPPPSPSAILVRKEDHWRGKISSSGRAGIYSCFSVSLDCCSVPALTMMQALYSQIDNHITALALLESGVNVGAGWWSLHLHPERGREQVDVEVGSLQPTPLLLGCLSPVSGGQDTIPEGALSLREAKCVCASMFCRHGFHISPNLSNRSRHLGREMDGTQNLKKKQSLKKEVDVRSSPGNYILPSCSGVRPNIN